MHILGLGEYRKHFKADFLHTFRDQTELVALSAFNKQAMKKYSLVKIIIFMFHSKMFNEPQQGDKIILNPGNQQKLLRLLLRQMYIKWPIIKYDEHRRVTFFMLC